jgi:NitT/TauT family transport system permease protein
MILLLIAGESLAASVGLGYRIFVVRRYLAMEIIIPYVLWMTILLFLLDMAFQYWKKWRYPWTQAI